jgi:hypothetical protein
MRPIFSHLLLLIPLKIVPVGTLRSSKRSQAAKPLVGSVAFRMASNKSTKAAVICQAQNPQASYNFGKIHVFIEERHCDG